MFNAYFAILVFIAIGVVIGLAPVFFSLIFRRARSETKAQATPYECGFPAISDARAPFNVRYYLVAILFIIFDLETAFLFPWAVSFHHIGHFGFWAMMVFLTILVVGFVYEWKHGALGVVLKGQ